MIKQSLIIIGLLFSIQAIAQTGIGTSTPHQSAKLDVSASNKGFLPPRVTLTSVTDATTIPSPAEGLLVYNLGSLGLQSGYYYWNGANWATIATASSAGNGVTATDMVKLYGEAHSKASGKIGNSTTGYVFSVPVSGRYLFDFTSAATTLNGGTNTIYFTVRQGTTVLASDMQSSYNNNVHVEYNGKVEVNLQAGVSYNLYNYATSGSFETNDYDRVYYKLVAGNLPVTGQSVDYVSVMLTTDQSNSTVGQNVKFQTIQSGNIPYDASTGNFSLTAGKTYRLTALASLNGTSPAGSSLDIIWRSADGTNLSSLGSLISASNSANFSGQGVVDCIFTPSVNTTVSLYISWVSNSATILRAYSTNATITQIGSSAIINPWVLSGTNTYNTTGNVGIGNNTPTEKLEVNGNVKANNFIGNASSTTLYLLEAHANVTYTLPGSYTSDPCRYSIVNNTVNVPSSWFNTSNYRFTPQKAGYWEITASYDVYRNSESALMMQKNGSNIALAGAIASVTQQINKIVYLNGSTDYITINNNGGSSNQRSQDSTKSWFQARWVGE